MSRSYFIPSALLFSHLADISEASDRALKTESAYEEGCIRGASFIDAGSNAPSAM